MLDAFASLECSKKCKHNIYVRIYENGAKELDPKLFTELLGLL